MANFGLAVWSLWRREVVRFLRQRSRVIGALATPAVFWFVIGSGVGASFRPPGSPADGGFLEYGFTGTLVLITLFTSIFSMISIIEDRQAGFLQGVLVSPVGRAAIVWGKVLGSTTLAVGQSMLFLCVAPIIGIPLSLGATSLALGVLVILGMGLSALGFALAWSMDSTQGFHAVMNLFLIPMWLLSGAFFPAAGAAPWIRWCMAVNPLTYGVSALRGALYIGSTQLAGAETPTGASMIVALASCVAMIVLALFLASRKSTK